MGKSLVGASQVRAWTTTRVPEAEQFAFWRDVVWEAFVPVALRREGEGPFRAEVTAWAVGPIGVSTIVSDPHWVSRMPEQITRRPGDAFFLNLPLSPGTSTSQAGRRAQPRKGDFVIVDSTAPFELEFTSPFRQVSLVLPHDLICPLLAAPWESTAVSVCGRTGVGAVASAAVRALADRGGVPDSAADRALAQQVAELIALSLGCAKAPPASANRSLLLRAAQDEAARSLGDPDLTPGRVAARIGISVRYLHQLFAEGGLSFGRWLLARRLEQSRRDLTDRRRAHWTITDIALHNGFRDPAYFSRTFRARYGRSPREERATHDRAAGPV
jgi:AraC-like DNA-binding protein